MRLNQQKQKRKNIVKKMTATIYVIAATETYIFSKTKIAETTFFFGCFRFPVIQ